MANLNVEPGTSTLAAMIAAVERGVLMRTNVSWSIDDSRNKFQFGCEWGELIENGRITTPVKGATLIGDGPTVLRHVTMVGNDLKLDQGVGICGKEGQSIPVSVGLPTIKIREITVGGTET